MIDNTVILNKSVFLGELLKSDQTVLAKKVYSEIKPCFFMEEIKITFLRGCFSISRIKMEEFKKIGKYDEVNEMMERVKDMILYAEGYRNDTK